MRTLRLIIPLFFLLLFSACSDNHSSRDGSLQFPTNSAEVQIQAASTLASASAEVEQIVAAEPRTFENTIIAYDRLYDKILQRCTLFSMLSKSAVSSQMRDASANALQEVYGWLLELNRNSGLYDAILEFRDKTDQYTGEEKTLLTTVLGSFNATWQRNQQEQQELEALSAQKLQLTHSLNTCLVNGDPDHQSNALLKQLVGVETAMADLYGYESTSAMTISQMMARTPATAEEFVQDIAELLAPDFQQLKSQLTELKRQNTQDANAVIYQEDRDEYLNQWIEQIYGIPFFTYSYHYYRLFNVEDVLSTLADIGTSIFGIDFIESEPPDAVWHDSVRYYQAFDHETDELLGELYIDLYSREGKLHTPTVFQLSSNVKREAEGDHSAIDALFMDFYPPEAGMERKLSMEEARLLFHEFGHVFNFLVSRSRYFLTARENHVDFVELPSQLLELWVSDYSVYTALCGGAPALSAEEFAASLELLKIYDFVEKGQTAVRNGILNLRLYAGGDVDPLVLEDAVLQEYDIPWEMSQEKRIPMGLPQFYNTRGGYYGYLWADVIARDIGGEFRKSGKGFMDADLGRKLRELIFEADYADDPEEVICTFLGRDWNDEAFYDYMSLGPVLGP